MNMGKKIMEYTEASEIPAGSSYLVAMGDGTGTKRVQHGALVEAVREGIEMDYGTTMDFLNMDEEQEESGVS